MASPPADGAARLALLHEIALALSSELDRRRRFEGVVHGARRLLDVSLAALASYDRGRDELVVEAADGMEVPAAGVTPGEMPQVAGRAFFERRTVVVDDLSSHPRPHRLIRELSLRGAMATPILRDGEPPGILLVAHVDPDRRFGAEDVRLLELLAAHVSATLRHAEATTAATRRLARVEELANAARGVMEARTRDVVIDRALDCATTVLGADRAAIFLLEGGEGAQELRASYAAGRRLSAAFLEHLFREYGRTAGGMLPLTRSSIFVPDASSDPRTKAIHQAAGREGLRSMLFVPLLCRDVILGALGVFHDVVWFYDPEDLSHIRDLSDQVALALANASLHERTSRQVAQLRVLEAMVTAVSEPLPPDERCRRGVQAIVAGGGASAAWYFRPSAPGEQVSHIQAGHSAVSQAAAEEAARAAIAERRSLTRGAGELTVVAAPIIHRDLELGALVLVPPGPTVARPRQGTAVVRLATGGELEDAPWTHEFIGAAAGQLATAIANARLYEEARTMGARLAVVIAGLPSAVLVFDRSDQVVLYNPKVLELYGLEGVDLVGWTPLDFVRELGHSFEDPAVPHEIARRIVEEKDRLHRLEFVLLKPRRRIVERISAPVLTPDGEWSGQVVLYHDVTDLRDAASKLRAMP